MSTYLRVNLALLPLPLFLVAAGYGFPGFGAAAGFAWTLGWMWMQRGSGRVPLFMAALATGLALVLVGVLVPSAGLPPQGVLMLALGLGAAASVALRRPWTAEFSAGDYGGMASTPLFRTVNMQMSALWAALFLWMALAAFAGFPPLAHWAPVVMGGISSVFLPRLFMARGLTRAIAAGRVNDWVPPRFGAPDNGGAEDEQVCDVAVVGAGLGGLTAAALLAEAGLKVAVFEQHVVAGGFAHTWLRRARTRDPMTGAALVFRFDSGVHDVSGWCSGGTVRNVFERLGIAGDTEWKRLDHRYVLDGRSIDVPRDWRAYVDQLAVAYPQEAEGIRRLFDDIFAIHAAMFSTVAGRGGIPGAPSTPEEMKAFAQAHPLAVAWMERPWGEFVGRHVRDPAVLKWINALGGYITEDIGRATVAGMVPIFGYYFHGGHYPMGGSGRMADSLVAAIERRGGQVHLRTPVRRIPLSDGAATGLIVETKGRERRVRARAVVCNADLAATMDGLLDDADAARAAQAQTGRLQPACSAVGVSLGIRGRLDLPAVVHVSSATGSVGMVIPSAVDPSCAPEGYAVVELLELVAGEAAQEWLPEEVAADPVRLEAWRHSEAYLARKREMGDRLIAHAAHAIPDLAERIVCRTDATPVTFHRYAWTSGGSIYGVRAANGRVPTRSTVRHLVFAGAATHGPGVEAVVISGAEAAEALLPGLLAGMRKAEVQFS